MTKRTDLSFTNHGSTILINPKTDAGRTWLDANVQADQWQRFGEAILIEHRALEDIVLGAREDGIVCNAEKYQGHEEMGL